MKCLQNTGWRTGLAAAAAPDSMRNRSRMRAAFPHRRYSSAAAGDARY
jgi:hypothetical protein